MRAKAVADGQQVEIPALRIYRTVGTQKDKRTGERKNPAKREAMLWRQTHITKVKRDGERRIVAKPPNPSCREKPLLLYPYPYRKPTQVDEEKIHRPTGEALLRNSAK